MSAAKTTHLGPVDLIVVLLINLLWGLNIVAVKMAVNATGPFTAGCLRLLVVALICLPFLRIVPGRMPLLLLLGLLNGAIFLIFVNLSLKVTGNVGALAIAGQLGVPISLLLAVVFLRERIALPRIIGVALCFMGVVLLLFDPGLFDEALGMALTLVSTLIWAIGALIQRRLAGVPVLTIYAWIGITGAAVLLPLSSVVEPAYFAAIPSLTLRDLGWMVFSAVGSTVIGQGGMAWLLQRHPMATVMPLTLGAPVVAVAASTLVFHTPLTPIMIVGGMIAMSGVAIITFRSARPRRPA